MEQDLDEVHDRRTDAEEVSRCNENQYDILKGMMGRNYLPSQL